MGGLGNQLFIYTAGLYLQELRGHDVSYYAPHLKDPKAHGYIHANSSILDLKLFVDPRIIVKSGETGKLIRDLVSAYDNRALPLHTLFSRMLPGYTSPQYGLDPFLDDLTKGTFVRGYFQSYKYLEALKSNGHQMAFELQDPSQSFLEWQERALDENPVIIHVRRGDYSKTPNLGMLSPVYYRKSIAEAKIRLTNTSPRFWFFSDDPDFAQALSAELGIDGQVISKAANLRPAEELKLMTFGSAHVIANSSFSWWGASMSLTSKFVIYPDKWFRGMEDPSDLVPANWIPSPSSWEDL
jgi:hypothetical protein